MPDGEMYTLWRGNEKQKVVQIRSYFFLTHVMIIKAILEKEMVSL